MGSTITCDVAIVGGGLAGALIALALTRRHRDIDVRVIDADTRIGGDHVWSFFASDIAAANRWMVEPAIAHAWRSYDVTFPKHERTIDEAYHSLTSERLDAAVRAALPERALILGRAASAVSPTRVVLADGDRIEATGVIDARGPADLSLLDLGWQKFVGHELVMRTPHAVERPIVMDATVAQIDGYRFVYSLPFSATRLFVEDTYYSDTPALDVATLGTRIADYAAARGWQVDHVAHRERGVLPVAMGGDFAGYWRSGGVGVAKAGMRAGLFQPTTGYSLPDAVRAAVAIAATRDLSGGALHQLTHALAATTWRRRGYYRMLNKMLFRAAQPAERYRVIERFYRLGPGLVRRFYSGQSTLFDKARILTGKPPVPVGRAIRAITT